MRPPATTSVCGLELLLDLLGGFNEVNAVVVVLLETRADGQNVEIKHNVLRMPAPSAYVGITSICSLVLVIVKQVN